MSIFDTAEELMAGALGDHFAERVRVVPKTRGRVVVGADDPTRPQYEVRAILDMRNRSVEPQGVGDRSGARSDVLVPLITLSIERAKIVAPGTAPQAGDEIIALDATLAHPANARFRVVSDAPLGNAFVDLSLMPLAE